ncbi:hypothetical protein MCOR06_000628 [Pyricularia oryzae]|nr:hypothetical protein MCOR06_000628 [Pyricularia oryzae]
MADSAQGGSSQHDGDDEAGNPVLSPEDQAKLKALSRKKRKAPEDWDFLDEHRKKDSAGVPMGMSTRQRNEWKKREDRRATAREEERKRQAAIELERQALANAGPDAAKRAAERAPEDYCWSCVTSVMNNKNHNEPACYDYEGDLAKNGKSKCWNCRHGHRKCEAIPSNLRLMAIAFTVARQNKDAKTQQNLRDGMIGIAAAKVDIPSMTRAEILAAHAAGKDLKRVL